MTTKITVEPAGHRIEVTTTDTDADGRYTTTREVVPNVPHYTVYIHSMREVTIREIPPVTNPTE